MTYLVRGRSHSVMTSDEYNSASDYDPYKLPDYPEYSKEGHFPWSVNQYGQDRERSESYSSSASGDSVECEYTPLESKHFERAMNSGMFSVAASKSKHERKKRYHHSQRTKSSCDLTSGSNKANEFQRPRSSSARSTENSNVPRHLRKMPQNASLESKRPLSMNLHKKALRQHLNEKHRETLSNSGINLHDISSELTLDEVYDLQQKFFSGMNLNRQLSGPGSTLKPDSHDGRQRSVSFN